LKPLILLVIALLGCQACERQTTQPAPQTPYGKWKSRSFHDYTIEQKRSCYCPNGGKLVWITIRSDTVAQVIRLSDSSVVTDPYYLTVDSLFGIIRNAGSDSLVIRYNDQYGYPEFLDVNPQSHPVDGGFLYESSNLHVR
jgi:hypothetical protein